MEDYVDIEIPLNGKMTIEKDSMMTLINSKEDKISICIEENRTLVLNLFDGANSNRSIDVTIKRGGIFVLNVAFICTKRYDLTINTELIEDGGYAKVNVRGINESDGEIAIKMNGSIKKGSKECRMDEFAKIINKSEKSNILIPNLLVDTNDVEANHGVAISNIDKNELLYLNSKGIMDSDAIKLIEKGFLLSIIPESEREKIKIY